MISNTESNLEGPVLDTLIEVAARHLGIEGEEKLPDPDAKLSEIGIDETGDVLVLVSEAKKRFHGLREAKEIVQSRLSSTEKIFQTLTLRDLSHLLVR